MMYSLCMEELLKKIAGDAKIRNIGNVESIVSIPIYHEDDYTSILYRFVESLDDKGIKDVLFNLKN